jgi:hypothetical protein
MTRAADEPTRKPQVQFGLRGLFRWMTVLASTAAIFAWVKPYFAVGVDPPLIALPFLAMALLVFSLAITGTIFRNRQDPREQE